MNYEQLNEIIQKRKEEIFNSNFTECFYNMISIRLNDLLLFIKENNLSYNKETRKIFKKYEQEKINFRNHYYIDYALDLLDYGLEYLKQNNNACKIMGLKEEIILSDYNQNIFDKYIEEVKEYNSEKTIKDKKTVLKHIMKYFQERNINNYEQLDADTVNKFQTYYFSFKYSNIKRYAWIFRDFINFLYNNSYIKINYNYLLENIKIVNNKKIPETFDESQINYITTALTNNTPLEKRDKAILLLAIRLGIRISDIRNLKFENINWITNEITFVQQKTGIINKLPLTEEIGNAIIDYVKNGRPKTTLRYIFVTHNDKSTKLNSSGNLRNYLTNIYKVTNINVGNKKGIHIFRRSLASQLLNNGNSLKIISSTLGHVNQDSAKNYLKIDNQRLKECCLEVPKYE